MKILIVYAHPNPASFNNGILQTVTETLSAANHEFRVRDLYALNFNPILSGSDFQSFQAGRMPDDIAAEQEHISWADALIYVYPIWWIGRPAIMQGYIDRVFAYGFAFSYDQNGAKGLLKNEKALVINTAGTVEDVYNAWPGSKELLTRPMDEGTLAFSGVTNVTHKVYFGVASSTPEQRVDILKEVKEIVTNFTA